MASFAYLEDLPIDFLKIDEALVKSCNHNPVSEVTVKAIQDIAHLLGFKTIAKSIEDADTLNKIQEIGINYGQGYYLGEPKFLAK
jgi:EAL domain-containing protein (putative c-di-GMP-specific phosphodiesterase class I)